MFELSVQTQFAAAHAITIAGAREPIHGHNWHVTVVVSGPTLDSDGLLCDFHTVESALRTICEQYHNRNLNDTKPFTTINPTAENVAVQIGEILVSELGEALAPHARIDRVTVTEAPGCAATYCLPKATRP
jgi:6-pyruvoyl-tetrahydropterin synthase